MDGTEDTYLLQKNFGSRWQSTRSHLPRFRRFEFWFILAVLLSLYAYNFPWDPTYSTKSRILWGPASGRAEGHNKDCLSKNFKKETLKVLMEFPFSGLFLHESPSKYEASDVIMTQDTSKVFVVFDNLFSIARLGRPHRPVTFNTSTTNSVRSNSVSSLLRWPGDPSGASDFEFIAYNESAKVYIVGQESVSHSDGSERAVTYDVTFNETSLTIGTRCVADFSFSHRNKGFEGAIVVTTKEGESLLVGLCEGNYCAGGRRGRRAGNGRLVVMKRVTRHGTCRYKTIDVVSLPRQAAFQDYSAITLWNETTVGIASQENSAIFLGKLDLDNGVKVTGDRIVDFPRNDHCEIKYCNVEGIAFANENTIVAVSDSMKSGGRQDFRCREKDESLAVFQMQ